MSKVKVAVNGFGTVGKRIADAVTEIDKTETDKKTKEDYERTIETLLKRIKYLEDKVDKVKDIFMDEFDPYDE